MTRPLALKLNYSCSGFLSNVLAKQKQIYFAFWSGHAQYNLSNLQPVPTKIRLFYIQAGLGKQGKEQPHSCHDAARI